MDSLTQFLAAQVAGGIRHIGQIVILHGRFDSAYALCHAADAPHLDQPAAYRLEVFDGPQHARELSTWAVDGSYRFTKGQLNLRPGWLLRLADATELRQALDGFYPAAVGLWKAQLEDRLGVQNLRAKLERQTGMYRYARTVSDAGAQKLVQQVCGPVNQCAKRILWQIAPGVPLADSEASRFPGILPGTDPDTAIPLLCQEACNHFVAECRQLARAEHQAAKE
jgi:sirohydrochlorin cobaltochelatase